MQYDDLDLVWEDDGNQRRRHRHRRSTRRAEQRRERKGRPPKSSSRPGSGRGGRTFVALVLSVVILGVLGGGIWYGADKLGAFFETPDYDTAGSGAVTVEVHKGDNLTDIGDTLAEHDVVKSSKAFVKAADSDARALGIGPGTYQMRQKMRAADALVLMLDPNTRVTNTVTLAEGMIAREMFQAMSKKTNIPVADFEAAAKDPVALGVPESWFARGDGKQVQKGIEGFLFPAQYEIPKNPTAQGMLSMMVQRFLETTTKLNFEARARNDRQISPYEVLICASIVEVEAMVAEDRPKVAQVLYNRLYGGKFSPRYLGLDSAVNYWFKAQGKDPKASQDLHDKELHNLSNPYNTHDVEGWPVGPISNPGEAAMTAALAPSGDREILYFVTVDKQGNTAFSKTLDEHNRNIEKAKKNGAM